MDSTQASAASPVSARWASEAKGICPVARRQPNDPTFTHAARIVADRVSLADSGRSVDFRADPVIHRYLWSRQAEDVEPPQLVRGDQFFLQTHPP